MRRDLDLLAQLDAALAGSDGEIELSAWAGCSGNNRFAASQLTQSGDVESAILQARVAEGTRIGTARTGALDGESIRAAIARAREVARASPENPDFAGFDDGKAPSPALDTWDEATATSGAGERAALLAKSFAVTDAATLEAAGSCATVDGAQAVATSAGCRRAYRFTTFKLDLIAADEKSSGFAAFFGHRAGGCDPRAVAEVASQRAIAGRDPIDLDPGEYDVILEPKALAETFEWLAMASLSARPLRDGSSCLAGKIGQPVTGARITLTDDALSGAPAALRAPFDPEGTPKRRVALIENGIARGVVNDRSNAKRDGQPATGNANALADDIAFDTSSPQHMQLAAGDDSDGDLLSRVERGLWVTRFHYVNGLLDTRRSLMTGMTRDGLLLVENGKITRGVRNLRWTESLLDALSREAGITRERRAVAAWWSATSSGGLLMPTVLLRRFRFTGRSR
jgi:predicted Zn-dependent protease